MKQPHAVDVLYISLLEVQAKRVFLRRKVQSVQGFCLSLCDGWNVWAASLFTVSGKMTTRVLYNDVAILVVQQGPLGITGVAAKAIKKKSDEAYN